MIDSNAIRVFPLSTPYWMVKSDGSGLQTNVLFASWYNTLGADEDTAVMYIEQNHPKNGLWIKTGYSVPAIKLVPYEYINRLMVAGGVMIIAGTLTGAYTVTAASGNQTQYVFKNGNLVASAVTSIPADDPNVWAIVNIADKVA
jgi:hypothetical protein